MTDPPRVSVVINTLNRAPYLRRLLGSLSHLDYPSFEVVVVNGPSTDGTEALLAEFEGRIKVAGCPEANLSRSRNIGIAAAAGDIVAFIDDDALPGSPEWLTDLVAALVRSPRAAGSGGPVLQGDAERHEFDGGATSDYGFQAFNRTQLRALGVALDGKRWVRRVPGGNCAFRHDVLLEIGGFDEAIPYYLDEADVCLRAVRAGFDIVEAPTATIRHYRAPSGQRRSAHDVDWRIIARSDTYYALKNGADPLPRRLLTTIRSAPRKHFFEEINRARREGQYGVASWMRYIGRWAHGLADGLWLGLTSVPRTPLVPGSSPSASFLPFRRDQPARRLRVGLLARIYPPHPNTGGIARYTQELAHALHTLGHEVHVFTEQRERVRREGLRLFVHGVTAEARPVLDDLPTTDRLLRWSLAVADRVIELAREGTVLDLVESPNWDSEGAVLRRSGLVPVVVRIVSPLAVVSRTEGWPASSDLQAAMALERWLIASADGATSPTTAMVATLRETMNLDLRRHRAYRPIALGVPPRRPVAAARSLQRRLLFVGRLERRKGIHTLLAVIPRLLERYSDLQVDIVGDDSIRVNGGPTFRQRFDLDHRRASWRRRCRFHGVVADGNLEDFYRDCALFVAPSLYESFGLIYLEAMRYGKPVVGCRVGGVPEVVWDGETGLLVPPEDPDALRIAIERLLDDPALGSQLGARARHVVETHFSPRRMAEQTTAFHARVLEEVGDQYRFGLARLVEEPIDLTDPTWARFSGDWRVVQGDDGASYHVSDAPGSTLHLTIPAHHALVFRFRGHPWSGVVSLAGDEPRRYCDLYREVTDDRLRWEVRPAEVPDTRAPSYTLVLEAEGNPLAQGREVWLQRVAVRR